MGNAIINQKDEVVINDLIFKELIKRGYSLEGNTRIWDIADSKLWYLTPDQAQAYLELVEKIPEYKESMIDNEISLLKEILPKIENKIVRGDEINILDIGCGDAKKAVVPINYLKNKTKINYCPIDISGYMIDKAIKNISKLNVEKVIQFKWNISDFENLENVTSLLRNGGKELLLLFLGGTLGNFEMHEVLYAINESMASGDSLLIGVSLFNGNKEKIEGSYHADWVDSFLGKVLEQIGFKRNEIKFNSRFRHSRVEMFYEIIEDKIINFQDKSIRFNKGDQIVVAFSYKFNKKELEDAIKLYYKNYQFFVNKQKDWALVLCKK